MRTISRSDEDSIAALTARPVHNLQTTTSSVTILFGFPVISLHVMVFLPFDAYGILRDHVMLVLLRQKIITEGKSVMSIIDFKRGYY